MPDPTLKRDDLLAALSEVADLMSDRGQKGRLYLAGGAAMVLAYSVDRGTQDVDAAIEAGYAAVMAAVHEVADRRGWTKSWLNERATAYMPRPEQRHSITVFEHPALTVLAATLDAMLAMKVRAGRRKDLSDIRHLLQMNNCTTMEQVETIVETIFPDEPLGERQRRWLADILPSSHNGTGQRKSSKVSPPVIAPRCNGKVRLNKNGRRDTPCVLAAGHKGPHRSIV